MSRFISNYWDMLLTSGAWLVLSFVLCGVLHAFLRPDWLQRSLGNKKLSSIIKATVSGMFLPICSCGVVPLTLGLYYSGAYLGPTLAFLVATPIINPAAVVLAYALLGKEIATIYLISGFLLPLIIGILGNIFAGAEIVSPHAANIEAAKGQAYVNTQPTLSKIKGGLVWGFSDLAVQTCRFILIGTAFAAFLLTVMPHSFIQSYLSSPQLISLLGAALLAAVMYVCALGHIPFIAALVGAGAAPGIAITFLLAGVATNLPELISIWRLIGKRTVLIYTSSVVLFSIFIGYMTNFFIGKDFMPKFDMSGTETAVGFANSITLSFPYWMKCICAVAVIAIGIYSWLTHVMRLAKNKGLIV